MENRNLNEAGRALWEARLAGALYDGDCHPRSLSEAYDLQSAAIKQSESPVCGYKVGATTDELSLIHI